MVENSGRQDPATLTHCLCQFTMTPWSLLCLILLRCRAFAEALIIGYGLWTCHPRGDLHPASQAPRAQTFPESRLRLKRGGCLTARGLRILCRSGQDNDCIRKIHAVPFECHVRKRKHNGQPLDSVHGLCCQPLLSCKGAAEHEFDLKR